MKKIYLLILLCGVTLQAGFSNEIVRMTRYTGEEITKLSVSGFIDVTLVKSTITKAVIEVPPELEDKIDVRLRNGKLTATMKDVNDNGNDRRGNKRKSQLKKVQIKLTLYLPYLKEIKLSGFSTLTSNDRFDAAQMVINLNGMAKLRKLDLDCAELSVKANGMAQADIRTGNGTIDLKTAGMAKVTINGNRITTINARSEGMSKITFRGTYNDVECRAAGMSKILADGITVSGNKKTSSEGMAKVRMRNIR